MATPDTAARKSSSRKSKVEEQAEQAAAATAEAAAADDKTTGDDEEQLNILEPKTEPRRWVIGKPPEQGGSEDEYSIYVQRELSYMARNRFFALVSKTIADSIKESGSIELGLGGMLEGEGTIRQRLAQQDFEDAGSFMALAMTLVAHSPDFLLDCYILWLDVPTGEKRWAKQVMNQRYAPEENKWGLTDEMGDEMIETFIDQNYEEIRRFFVERLPRLAKRVMEREKDRADRESASALSKQ